MHDMIDDTAQALAACLNGSGSLRRLAADLYGDASKTGLLADVLHQRAAHVSHAALHDLRRRLGLAYDVRHIIDIPNDQDAQTYITPNGTGSFHVEPLPAGAEIVIVPAGARIVQGKPASSKPARKRNRMEIGRWLDWGLTRAEMAEILDIAAAEKRDLRSQMEVDYQASGVWANDVMLSGSGD